MRIRKLNVQATQLENCVRLSMFALPNLPKYPFERGDILLLQVVKKDARDPHARIRFALVLDRVYEDVHGESERIWGRPWRYIVRASCTIPTIPFSFEDIPGLRGQYVQQGNIFSGTPLLVEDEPLIWPYLQGDIQLPEKVPALELEGIFGKQKTLDAIRNRDLILKWEGALPRGDGQAYEPREDYIARRKILVPEHEEYYRDPWLAEALKGLYRCKCQICGHDFTPAYGHPFAETHHVQALHAGGVDTSKNIIVVCPNHHRIIEATRAEFNPALLQFEYPNRRVERLKAIDHLVAG